jgi:hypothetical protein
MRWNTLTALIQKKITFVKALPTQDRADRNQDYQRSPGEAEKIACRSGFQDRRSQRLEAKPAH